MKNNSQVNAYCLTSNYLLENHSIYSHDNSDTVEPTTPGLTVLTTRQKRVLGESHVGGWSHLRNTADGVSVEETQVSSVRVHQPLRCSEHCMSPHTAPRAFKA